jgi:Uri superfamily endonuclease
MSIVIRGDGGQSGVYLLAIRVAQDLDLSFGRFQGGRPIHVPAGLVIYAGSARGRGGATALAGRLLRHATRSGSRPAHGLRGELTARFTAAGLVNTTLSPKTLRWHIDYLLDEPAAELVGVFAIRTGDDLESVLVERLIARPDIISFPPGLGASDKHGYSHLMRLETNHSIAE